MPLTVPADVSLTALGIYNVKDPAFGAVGNGTTDDTVAIQTAINAAFSAGGGIVYLPSSKYLLNGGPLTPPTQPGGTNGTYMGTTSIPTDPHTGLPYVLTGMAPPNNGVGNTKLPNGPLLLFDKVVLVGDGPEQTILLAGPNIYGGNLVAPDGNSVQDGTLVATANWWADYLDPGGFPVPFQDGFYAHDVYVLNFSIDCQGRLGVNAGLPSHVIAGAGSPIINPAVQLAADGVTPVGQLSNAALTIHATQNCGVDNVWVYDGNVNGIALLGTKNAPAHIGGPLPQSFQQYKTGIPTFKPNATPTQTNVPVMNASITRSQVDMNYPLWLAGSFSSTGGSKGQLPIRAVGVAGVDVSANHIGQRNQPSSFPTPPPTTTNPPNVGPNTNDAMDCPGAWHILIFGNLLTNCGDGVGSPGNGDMIVACNVMYNFGAVGVLSPSTEGKSASQAIIFGNTIFLGSDFGSQQQAIAILDQIPAMPSGDPATSTSGSVVIANNVIYGSAYNVMIELQVLGATVVGNVLDYAGVQPAGQPVVGGTGGTTGWPTPSGSGIKVEGNDIIIEGNMFRNANNPAGTANPNATGIVFPSSFPPSVSPDTVRVLVKGNIFDKTIGKPIQDNSSGTDGLLGVRILDNIGVNPVGALNTALVPFPTSTTTFSNPYPYDAFVTVACGSAASVTRVTLNGVITGATITSSNQKSFLVKAGGTISMIYTGSPTWVWVGL